MSIILFAEAVLLMEHSFLYDVESSVSPIGICRRCKLKVITRKLTLWAYHNSEKCFIYKGRDSLPSCDEALKVFNMSEALE